MNANDVHVSVTTDFTTFVIQEIIDILVHVNDHNASVVYRFMQHIFFFFQHGHLQEKWISDCALNACLTTRTLKTVGSVCACTVSIAIHLL